MKVSIQIEHKAPTWTRMRVLVNGDFAGRLMMPHEEADAFIAALSGVGPPARVDVEQQVDPDTEEDDDRFIQ